MKRYDHIATKVMLAVLAAAGVCRLAQAAESPNWYVVQLPNYSGGSGWPGATDSGAPRVFDWNVVWTSRVPDPIWVQLAEIFLFDGAATRQLSNSTKQFGSFGAHICDPYQVSDSNNVVWIGDDGPNYDVFGYDMANGIGPTQLIDTSDVHLKRISSFHDPYAVVECMDQWPGSPWIPTYIDLYLFDGTGLKPSFTKLPTSRTYNCGGEISNSYVVWHAYNSGAGTVDIFVYDISSKTTTQLTTGGWWSNWRPQISGSYVVWYAQSGPPERTRILLADLSSLPSIPTFTEIASYDDLTTPYLCISGSKVVWEGIYTNASGQGIFLYDINSDTTVRIYPTNPTHLFTGQGPEISDRYAAWWASDGIGVYEIYTYDLNTTATAQVAVGVADVLPIWLQVSSKAVVWEKYNAITLTNEGFMATRPNCNPVPRADFNSDCTIDLWDYNFLVARWGSVGDPADITGDGAVNFLDLAILFSEWLDCNIQPPIYSGMGVVF